MQLFITLQARNDFFCEKSQKRLAGPSASPLPVWNGSFALVKDERSVSMEETAKRFDPINHDFSRLSRKIFRGCLKNTLLLNT